MVVTAILALGGSIELASRGIEGYPKASNPTGAFLFFFVAGLNLACVSLVAWYAIRFSLRKRRRRAVAA